MSRKHLPLVVLGLSLLCLCLPLSACAPSSAPSPDASTHLPATWMVPDFTVIDESGTAVRLSSFAGRPIVLNFWASWCPPCKAEMPDFQTMYEVYGDRVSFVIVNLTDGYEETISSATNYARGQGYTFPLYFDTSYSASNAYGISSIPRTYFITDEGVLSASKSDMINAQQLQTEIEKLLA